MANTIDALKNLYVAMDGNEDDVADLSITPDMINAIAAIQGQGGGGKLYEHNLRGTRTNTVVRLVITSRESATMNNSQVYDWLFNNGFRSETSGKLASGWSKSGETYYQYNGIYTDENKFNLVHTNGVTTLGKADLTFIDTVVEI